MKPVVELKSTYKGYPYVVLFMPGCYRCGYVAIKKGDKYYKKEIDDICICCHGGITYSNPYLLDDKDDEIW